MLQGESLVSPLSTRSRLKITVPSLSSMFFGSRRIRTGVLVM
jgi:hypothetical protein